MATPKQSLTCCLTSVQASSSSRVRPTIICPCHTLDTPAPRVAVRRLSINRRMNHGRVLALEGQLMGLDDYVSLHRGRARSLYRRMPSAKRTGTSRSGERSRSSPILQQIGGRRTRTERLKDAQANISSLMSITSWRSCMSSLISPFILPAPWMMVEWSLPPRKRPPASESC